MKIIDILQESLNMILTVETLEGISYKGIVIEVDDYMNIHLKDVDVNYKDNTVQYKKNIFIRGTSIKYFILPPILAKLSS
jgi:small nuclear ribonucleoprotein D3